MNEETTTATEKTHLLIVDDEESIREFLTILLEKEGYQVATAESVASGKRQVEEGSFDLVMCDLKLPDGTGLDVLAEARKQQVESPFIIITAHTTPQHALEALRAGAAEYLSKPFNVEDLKLIVVNALIYKRGCEKAAVFFSNIFQINKKIRVRFFNTFSIIYYYRIF